MVIHIFDGRAHVDTWKELNKQHYLQKQLIREVERVTERLTETYPCDSCNVKVCYRQCYKMTLWAEKAKEKLAGYENAEEVGELLMLPCKVRDYIWDIEYGTPCSYEITGFSIGNLNDEAKSLDKVIFYYSSSDGSITGKFAVSEIGKTVFLTREEAEKALKEMGNK